MSIRILVVDDSQLARKFISEFLSIDPELEIIGTAQNGQEAIELTKRLKPDLITMDISMPVMDGLLATEHIMAYQPTPILVMSNLLKSELHLSFQAISTGAVEAVEKPDFSEGISSKTTEKLIRTVKLVSNVKVITHLSGKLKRHTSSAALDKPKTRDSECNLVAIGASTGGPKVLAQILSQLPKNFSSGIVIVQHISTGFTSGLVDWLNRECPLEVKEAKSGEQIKPGLVFVAPCENHMLVTNNGRIRLNKGLPVSGNRPSVSILMSSIAKVYGKSCMGVILTGMGEDGATGMLDIKQAGGATVAQDENSSAIFGMPKAAIDAGAVDKILNADEIGQLLVNKAMRNL
ncbi:chemotaxis response regulator protein-glutamate methylesterase [Candidatus Poribacteria bacterium]|jgi:two-component system chemotaxis response regulator CheB|nr:chemotaxis response regulator protein-glutamate methylesterase [Candidatus Poribacteria bacterium]